METFGRYEFLRKIASGGMGQVFLARQKGPVGFQKLLVVKRLLPHLSEEEEFIQMFLDEARIAALLNHPNIAQIYELGEVDGIYFIAMEYVHGEAIAEVNKRAVQRKGHMPLELKCRVIADAAAGLDAAHHARSPSGRKLSLIHRDVSPQNVLVGFNGSVKIIDFGVAKAAGKLAQTVVGTIKGKHAYMSPEQARGEPLDHRSDVFGLGTVFYELLTQTRLFKRESELATLKAVVGAKVVPPSEVTPGIPKALDAVVLKALARNRDERFGTAGELQLAIEDFLVKHRLPGTTAHLAAFMRELYTEELEEEFSTEPTIIAYDPRLMGGRKAQASGDEHSGPTTVAPAPKAPAAKGVPPARVPKSLQGTEQKEISRKTTVPPKGGKGEK
ncbi:serine/threonine protein kinase [Stigmatella erecta]|uniref:non-specific serine/threonine protein kinase n=2 Tax=Stigmatella erecta TaxID=83460 RepID=A0A1I0DWK4_9BACT|nr:serine/threonine-protein kinase [Stigmatella erecta]SET36741.1 serine/threonine protein kinase [Stigmatella erecta]